MPARNLIAVAVLALAASVAWAWYGRTAPEPAPVVLTTIGGDVAAGTITVHVSGQVAIPGLVVVADDARLADAIAAAGGTTRRAALDRVNLAAPLQDGQQVVIPAVGDETLGLATTDDGKVHINTATATEMEQLPGVGPVLAERILAFRDENGLFAAVEDLLDIPGIGEAKLAALRDSVALP
jgi:competence protein ComEA